MHSYCINCANRYFNSSELSYQGAFMRSSEVFDSGTFAISAILTQTRFSKFSFGLMFDQDEEQSENSTRFVQIVFDLDENLQVQTKLEMLFEQYFESFALIGQTATIGDSNRTLDDLFLNNQENQENKFNKQTMENLTNSDEHSNPTTSFNDQVINSDVIQNTTIDENSNQSTTIDIMGNNNFTSDNIQYTIGLSISVNQGEIVIYQDEDITFNSSLEENFPQNLKDALQSQTQLSITPYFAGYLKRIADIDRINIRMNRFEDSFTLLSFTHLQQDGVVKDVDVSNWDRITEVLPLFYQTQNKTECYPSSHNILKSDNSTTILYVSSNLYRGDLQYFTTISEGLQQQTIKFENNSMNLSISNLDNTYQNTIAFDLDFVYDSSLYNISFCYEINSNFANFDYYEVQIAIRSIEAYDHLLSEVKYLNMHFDGLHCVLVGLNVTDLNFGGDLIINAGIMIDFLVQYNQINNRTLNNTNISISDVQAITMRYSYAAPQNASNSGSAGGGGCGNCGIIDKIKIVVNKIEEGWELKLTITIISFGSAILTLFVIFTVITILYLKNIKMMKSKEFSLKQMKKEIEDTDLEIQRAQKKLKSHEYMIKKEQEEAIRRKQFYETIVVQNGFKKDIKQQFKKYDQETHEILDKIRKFSDDSSADIKTNTSSVFLIQYSNNNLIHQLEDGSFNGQFNSVSDSTFCKNELLQQIYEEEEQEIPDEIEEVQ